MSVKMRQFVEREIARAAIGGCIARGHNVTVYDGEEKTLVNSIDRCAILAAMFTVDEEYLLVDYNVESGKSFGWVRFVYGNDGWDVINDYTTNLEQELKGAQRRADFWQDKQSR